MPHFDYTFPMKDVNHELLLEELQAASVKGLIGVQVAPSGGVHQHQKQVPAPEAVPNPKWKGWVVNPAWSPEKDGLVPHYVVNPTGWKPNPEWTPERLGRVPQFIADMEVQNTWGDQPSHLIKTYDPSDYYVESVIPDSGTAVTVRLANEADSDQIAIINGVIAHHDATGLTAAAKAEKANADERAAALATIATQKTSTNPEIRALAEAVSKLLEKPLG